MIAVKVEILRIIDGGFPAFAECMLVDCNGKKHYFQDKFPVFSSEYITEFPHSGEMRCQMVQNKQNTLIIDTSMPDDITSINGEHKFEIYKSQVSEKYPMYVDLQTSE